MALLSAINKHLGIRWVKVCQIFWYIFVSIKNNSDLCNASDDQTWSAAPE